MVDKLNKKFLPPITVDMIGSDLSDLINQTKGYELLSLLVNKSIMTGFNISSSYTLTEDYKALFSVGEGEYVYDGAYFTKTADSLETVVDGDTRYQVTEGLITETKFGRKDHLVVLDALTSTIKTVGGELARQGESPKLYDLNLLPDHEIALYYLTIDKSVVKASRVFEYTKSNADLWREVDNKIDKEFVQQFILQLNEIKSTLEEKGITDFVNQYENGYYNVFKDSSEIDLDKTDGFTLLGGLAQMNKGIAKLKIMDMLINGGFKDLDLYVYLNNNLSVLNNDGAEESNPAMIKLEDLTLSSGDVVFIDNKPYQITEVLK